MTPPDQDRAVDPRAPTSAASPTRCAPSAAAGADYVHVDVMDGHFVPNLTIGPMVVAAIRKATTLPLDVHLMIERPERLHRRVRQGRRRPHRRARRGLPAPASRACSRSSTPASAPSVTLNPHTPWQHVRHVLEDVAQVLIMSVNPGFGGQAFIPNVLPKIRELREEIARRGLDVDIEVDGGIKVDNVAAVVEAGANVHRRRQRRVRDQRLQGDHRRAAQTPNAEAAALRCERRAREVAEQLRDAHVERGGDLEQRRHRRGRLGALDLREQRHRSLVRRDICLSVRLRALRSSRMLRPMVWCSSSSLRRTRPFFLAIRSMTSRNSSTVNGFLMYAETSCSIDAVAVSSDG